MRRTISSLRDLRNWVDEHTAGWLERTDADVDAIADAIRAGDCPAWGADWTDYLASLPELTELLPA